MALRPITDLRVSSSEKGVQQNIVLETLIQTIEHETLIQAAKHCMK